MKEKQIISEQDPKGDIYQRGHAIGYMLAQMEPATAKDFADIPAKVPILEGFRSGVEEFERERSSRETIKMPEWLKPDRAKIEFNEKAIDRDRNRDIEPER